MIALTSYASKLMLKIQIHQARCQQYVNQELPGVQTVFRLKVEEPEIKLPTCVASKQKQENSRKTSPSVSLTTLKPLFGSRKTVENSSRWEYQTTLPASCETSMQVKTEQLELDMEQWTGLKLGKEYVKAAYCHPAYLTYV